MRCQHKTIEAAQSVSRATTHKTWLVTLRNILGVVHQGCGCDVPCTLAYVLGKGETELS